MRLPVQGRLARQHFAGYKMSAGFNAKLVRAGFKIFQSSRTRECFKVSPRPHFQERPAVTGSCPMLTDWSVNTPAPSPPQEGFSGLIERITFHSEETGFAVLRVKVKGHRELVTVVGDLASVNAGEWITTH